MLPVQLIGSTASFPLLQMGQQVKMVRTQTSSLAVDTRDDVALVEKALSELGLSP